MFLTVRFLGFWCCLKAFSIGNILTFLELLPSFALAWIIGLVIPAAPGGVGVFEATILFGIGDKLPKGPLLASLLCYRLASTFADILTVTLVPIKEKFLK